MVDERPHRVQVAGDFFHPVVPAGAVYVGRNGPGLRRSKFHNPFRAGKTTPLCWTQPFGGVYVLDVAHAVELFRQLVADSPGYRQEVRDELAGKVLACWCPPDSLCHADYLLAVANSRVDS